MAPGAKLTVFAIDDRAPEGPTEEEELGWFGSALAPEAGLHILNISFGSRYDLISDYPDEVAVRARYGRLMELLAQRDKAEPSLIVFAAGNDNGPCDPAMVGAFGDPSRCVAVPEFSEVYGTPTGLFFAISPGVDAALQVHAEALRSHVVSVVATRRDRELASFSNRCGIAAPWCIAAPGVDVPVAYYGPEDPADPFASGLARPRRGQERLPGTSFAAPLVAGGLAVLKHRFRGQLGNEALLTRLYATADKQGPAAPDAVPIPGVCPGAPRSGWGFVVVRALVDARSGDHGPGRGDAARRAGQSGAGKQAGAGRHALCGKQPRIERGSRRCARARPGRSGTCALRRLGRALLAGLGALVRSPEPGASTQGWKLSSYPTRRRSTRGAGSVTHAPGSTAALVDTPLGPTSLRLGLHRASGAHEWTGGHASLATAVAGGRP